MWLSVERQHWREVFWPTIDVYRSLSVNILRQLWSKTLLHPPSAVLAVNIRNWQMQKLNLFVKKIFLSDRVEKCAALCFSFHFVEVEWACRLFSLMQFSKQHKQVHVEVVLLVEAWRRTQQTTAFFFFCLHKWQNIFSFLKRAWRAIKCKRGIWVYLLVVVGKWNIHAGAWQAKAARINQ